MAPVRLIAAMAAESLGQREGRCAVRPRRRVAILLLCLAPAAAAAGCGRSEVAGMELDADGARLYAAMLAEEDSRPTGGLEALAAGLESGSPALRSIAVRGVGRLQRPELLNRIAPLLDDPDPGVRAAAADAVAQAVSATDSPEAADLLLGRLSTESDAATAGAVGEAMGRLRPASSEALAATEGALVARSRGAPIETLLPLARGLESLVRRNARELVPSDAAVARLVELSRYGRSGAEGALAGDPGDERGDVASPSGAGDAAAAGLMSPAAGGGLATDAPARVRRLALATLVAARRVDADTVETALYDPDGEVRRLAALAADRLDDADTLLRMVQIGQADGAAEVRYEALRIYGRRFRATMGCGPVVAALDDDDPQVAIEAIDLLGGCPAAGPTSAGPAPGAETAPSGAVASTETPARRLDRIVRSLAGLEGEAAAPATLPDRAAVPDGGTDGSTPLRAPTGWRGPAHALVGLAALDPTAAMALIPAFARHPIWQVRMHAARAAARAAEQASDRNRAIDALEALAADPQANVADAALRGLDTAGAEGADAAALRALHRDDYQLLITAAGVLDGSRADGAASALLDTLDRITAQRRQTSRDARRALLERAGALGGAAEADRLRPYLHDFDPLIAEQAAQILVAWTGAGEPADPRPLPAPPLPPYEELRALAGARAVLHMEGGGDIEIALLPFEAPTNVARFVRQARDGYFDDLTFHRVVPNFVIQGGSPGANEYMGAAAFSRDELTPRSHLRGTVGISTRGRDTGDGQIFVNLVDNVRLDHDYTIIGVVTAGMDVVDAVLEGAVIERVSVVGSGGPSSVELPKAAASSTPPLCPGVSPDRRAIRWAVAEAVSISWEQEAGYFGAFKLTQPGQYDDQWALFRQGCGFDDIPDRGLYLAGDGISWAGGWVEGALRTGLNAAGAVVHRLGGWLHQGFLGREAATAHEHALHTRTSRPDRRSPPVIDPPARRSDGPSPRGPR